MEKVCAICQKKSAFVINVKDDALGIHIKSFFPNIKTDGTDFLCWRCQGKAAEESLEEKGPSTSAEVTKKAKETYEMDRTDDDEGKDDDGDDDDDSRSTYHSVIDHPNPVESGKDVKKPVAIVTPLVAAVVPNVDVDDITTSTITSSEDFSE